MADARKFSRERRKIKLTRREAVERELNAILRDALRERDPTAPLGAIHVIAELVSVIASQLLAQTQATQRTLMTMKDDIAEYGTEFVAQLIGEAGKDVRSRVERTMAAIPTVRGLQLADDWAGPVAGPTLIERHFGIPRSTLYRWQQRGEVVSINTRTSKKPVFPLRQFVDGRPADGIAETIAAFDRDPRAAWLWLVTPNVNFDQRAPLDILLQGKVERVVAKALEVRIV